MHIDSDLDLVKKLAGETIEKGDEMIRNAPKQILVNNLGADNIELKILVWIKSVYSEAAFKSYVLETLYRKFRANGIKIM
ncbi:hypothetical protein [Dyadobacter sp. 676]|uniref:Mechanosensitive ion channel MscS C-terminal domain-containing protein n=1 Tax=Dyadobacter sp. 676 TaxID=3088362 RepID=A0AAU8FU54_9BACT